MFGLSRNTKEEIVLLCDIGNGSIGGAFASFSSDKVPRIIYNTRISFAVLDTTDAAKMIEGVSALLLEMFSILMDTGSSYEYWRGKDMRISSALVTFSSPWFFSKTKHIVISDEKEFIITKAFLDDVIAKEGELFKKELVEKGTSEEAFALIENSIVHTKINGYTLNDSIGKRTNSFDAFLSMSVAPQNVVKLVEDCILKHTHVGKDRIFMRTFPLVSFSVIRDIFHNTSDFILMDVTGEVTDMTVVSDGAMVASVSFPSGRNFIIRQVAKAFDVSPEIALSTLHMYAWDKTDNETKERMVSVLADVAKEWTIYYEDARSSLSSGTILPKMLYMTADADTAPFFLDFLKTSGVNMVTHISGAVIDKLYETAPKLFSDEFIGILAVFYNKMRGS